MELSTLGLLALLLVCPIAMMLMMRGGGHGGHGGHGEHDQHDHRAPGDHVTHMSDEQLRELSNRAQRELEERKAQSHT